MLREVRRRIDLGVYSIDYTPDDDGTSEGHEEGKDDAWISCVRAFMHSCIHAFSTTTTTRETDEPGFVRLNNNDRLERVMDEISHCA